MIKLTQFIVPNKNFYCKKCFSNSSYSSYTHIGRVIMYVDDKCQVCVGKGIVPIPLTEVVKDE